MAKENLKSEYVQKLQEVSVIGAGGKMGAGIVLLISVELMELSLLPENRKLSFNLNAIDISNEALYGLRGYLKTQITKIAEKRIVSLRKVYNDSEHLIENSDIINQYVEDVMRFVNFSSSINSAYSSTVIFEAAVENIKIKKDIIKQVFSASKNTKWFLSNTSSIPICVLENEISDKGTIIGYHFYNPPVIQKLIELITTKETDVGLIKFAHQLAGKLNKHIIPSNDIAGFIGNGHFMRDLLYCLNKANSLKSNLSFVESIWAINRITHDFLIRPMGIFQLMDYVGIDVCQKILHIMKEHLKDEGLKHEFIDQLLAIGVKGGQKPDGSQKNGMFKYQKNKPIGVYDINQKEYVNVDILTVKVNQYLGEVPESHQKWKNVIKLKNRNGFLSAYFKELKEMNSQGSGLALKYLENSCNIGKQLVQSGVAANEKDLNDVLMMGFYHAYGPINEFCMV